MKIVMNGLAFLSMALAVWGSSTEAGNQGEEVSKRKGGASVGCYQDGDERDKDPSYQLLFLGVPFSTACVYCFL